MRAYLLRAPRPLQDFYYLVVNDLGETRDMGTSLGSQEIIDLTCFLVNFVTEEWRGIG